MTSCLISSMNELLVLLIDGAREALEEPYRESLPRLGSTAGGGFSVIAIVSDAAAGAEAAGGPRLPALK